jgi:hypothetical protein
LAYWFLSLRVIRFAEEHEALLFARVLGIVHQPRQWVTKDGAGFVERDAVLLAVGVGLLRIPDELEWHASIYLCTADSSNLVSCGARNRFGLHTWADVRESASDDGAKRIYVSRLAVPEATSTLTQTIFKSLREPWRKRVRLATVGFKGADQERPSSSGTY